MMRGDGQIDDNHGQQAEAKKHQYVSFSSQEAKHSRANNAEMPDVFRSTICFCIGLGIWVGGNLLLESIKDGVISAEESGWEEKAGYGIAVAAVNVVGAIVTLPSFASVCSFAFVNCCSPMFMSLKKYLKSDKRKTRGATEFTPLNSRTCDTV